MSNEDLRYCTHEDESSWEEYDARGIYLCRVCDKCVKTKLAGYRPEVLIDSSYSHDEPISDEHWDY